MKDLRGKTAIVTGASRGLGVYIAKELAANGVNLVLAARSREQLEETRRICVAGGVKAIPVAADVTSLDDLRRLVATAEREFGAVDILVNNAGIELVASIADLSIEQIDDMIRTNLNAPIWLTKLVLPSMLSRRSGAIVNVASLAGKGPVAYDGIYATTKAGLINFTQSLHLELKGTGVTAGVVCPGFVSDAGMWANHAATGARLPWTMREVSPARVVRGVMQAIRGKPEVLVAQPGIRPLLAIGELIPGARLSVVDRLGVTRLFREEAERLALGEDRKRAPAPASERGEAAGEGAVAVPAPQPEQPPARTE